MPSCTHKSALARCAESEPNTSNSLACLDWTRSPRRIKFFACHSFQITAGYLREALSLSGLGMTDRRFFFRLVGKTEEMEQRVWSLVKRAAEIQEAGWQVGRPYYESNVSKFLSRLVKKALGGGTPVDTTAVLDATWRIEQAKEDWRHRHLREWEQVIDLSDYG